MSINLTERFKETLQAGVDKTCLEFGLWPHLATFFIKSAALGHTRVWGQPGCFHPTYTMQNCLLALGLPSILPPAQVSWLSQTQEAGNGAGWITGLISSDKSLVVTSFRGRRLLRGGGGREEAEAEKGQGLRIHQDDYRCPMPPACLHICPAPNATSCLHIYLERTFKKCPGVKHREVSRKKLQGFWSQIILGSVLSFPSLGKT